MKYAEVEDVEAGFRTMTSEEQRLCYSLLEEAAVVIDGYNRQADEAAKRLVSCRMVRRQLDSGIAGAGAVTYPTGASQGSASALGYTQSWTMTGGSVGELYLTKTEKHLLGLGNRIGTRSPVEDLIV